MNNLPVEILNQIFLFISQQDKVECMAACRKWKQIIERANLFRTIHVNTGRQLDFLVEKVQAGSGSIGEKVEHLLIGWSLAKWENQSLIFECFPNLRTLLSFSRRFSDKRFVDSQLKTQPWKNLEYLHCVFDDLKMSKMFELGVYPNLTKLVLYSQGYDCLKLVAERLKNAPALKILLLYRFLFDISDLELLHSNAPGLISLTLHGEIKENTVMDKYFQEVKPATRITRLNYKNYTVAFDRDLKGFQYLRKKYTNVGEFIYNGCSSLLSKSEMNRLMIDGIIPFLDSLGDQLKILSLDLPYLDSSLIDSMKHFRCQLNEFRLIGDFVFPTIETLARSNMAKHIQIFSAKGSNADDRINLKTLVNFTSLKELHLEYTKTKTININELFHLVGDTLETLRLSGFDMVFDDPSSSQHIHQIYKLKNLVFTEMFFPIQIEDFINNSLPSLKNLTLNFCDLDTRPLSIKTDLSRLKVKAKFPVTRHTLLIKTASNGERWYWADQIYYEYLTEAQNDSHIDVVLPITKFSETSQSKPFGTFECHSVQSVIVLNDWRRNDPFY